mgnify:CR=1 FL=1
MAEMSLEQRQYLTAKFKEFIAAVHSSHESNLPVRTPYQWQIRLMLYVAEHGYWPRSIGAPTASGKTSVIDIHVFLNAMAGLSLVEGNGLFDLPLRNIPRRLALTVNRRSLVDDQFDEACALQDKMQIEHVANDGLDVYRDGLKLRAAINDGTKSDSAIPRMIAVELRGSISPDREWRYYPQTCAVICATPDMFGSRLLFRGYGTSRTMRSMEAGLLAYDTVLIVDEAHLSQQLLKTAQQVARIENMADAPIARQVSPLQVVETTATPVSEDTDNPISLVANYMFCPRRAWLEAVGEKVDSDQIMRGTYDHRKVDRTDGAPDADSYQAVNIRHEEWGVSGKLDAAKMTDSGIVIREYKATPVKRAMIVTPAMRTQLALQAACLENMGFHVAGTEIFFTTHHRRVEVDLDEEDYENAHKAVEETRTLINSEQAPEPLEDSARCMRCSHVGICLPEERKLCAVAHRVMVSSPDNQVTHLATPGAKAFTRSGRMIVQKNGEELASIPIDTMQGLQIYGNTDLSSGLIRELMWRDIPIVWCSGTGRMYGWSIPSYGPNGEQRVDQHVASHEGRLGLAREFIVAKIHNQSVLLRRSESDNPVLPQLRHIEKQVGNANRWQDILGLEGESAALYFSQFEHLIKTDRQAEWPWIARMRRPAPDALNALLDFTYTLLLSDCVRALISCGLDPHAGFLHSSKRNKPALALDLMEEFRAPIADSVVQTVINNGEINASGFSDALGSVRMTDETRKTVIKAYERRMATEIIHPVFKYKASWRRTIEIQARMILGYLDGTQTEYRGIRIR